MSLRSSGRAVALIAALVGAVASAGLTLYAGRHSSSQLLRAIFVVWVLSPFMLLLLGDAFSKRWPDLTRTVLHGLMLVVTLASLAIYGYVALGPPRPHAATVFVVVPPASWLLIAIVVAVAALISRRRAK